MNIIQITPGAGAMFCGNCFRDNALVAELRAQGHEALMIPLYLPLTLDERDQSAGIPVFYNGITVYLEQKSPWFRRAPQWVHNLLSSRTLLKWAAGGAAKTRASDLGDITLSMIQGEHGNQARELDRMIGFFKEHSRPEIICLSNVMLAGMARRMRAELRCPVACVLQGEDVFLDALPDSHRDLTWKTLAERCADIDLFISPSQYFADLMAERLSLPAEKIRVIPDGINLAGYESAPPPARPTIGFFARMCREKGLDTLVEAFIRLKKRDTVPHLQLKIGGGCGPADEPFVAELRQRMQSAGFLGDVSFHPNVTRAEKQAFLRSLTVFSVPALYGESFGLYLVEALAGGVPVVQPRHASFPEIVGQTGGGILCEAGSVEALADALESLLLDPVRARELGGRGCDSVRKNHSSQNMARQTVRAFQETAARFGHGG